MPTIALSLLTLLSMPAAAIDLPVVPSVPPGTVAALPVDPLAEARRRYHQADYNGARAILEPHVGTKGSRRQRTATRLLLGRVYLELGLFNHASAQFYQVRRGEGGDAKVAAWYEALADLKRGRPHATINECRAYIEKHTQGRRVSECMVLIGDAKAKQGQLGAARKAYNDYLERPEHAGQLRGEEMNLRIALATAEHAPEQAIPLLQHLALNHRFAATGQGAMNTLVALAEAGHTAAVIPEDTQSQMALAVSLRRSGLAAEAWSLFQALSAQAETDPEVASWVTSNTRSFVRSTRHPLPETLAEVAAYQAKGGGTGNRAWTIFEGWRKAGRWAKAAKWGSLGLEKHGKAWPWRGQRDEVAHAIMLSGDWAAASTAWKTALKARNGPKNLALFYRSLTAYLSGDTETAEAGFSTLVTRGGRMEMPARYWRVRTRESTGKTNTMVDRTRIAADDPTGWYKLLLQPPQPSGEGWLIRDGTWRGAPVPVLAVAEGPDTFPGVQVGVWPAAQTVLYTASGSRRGLDAPDSTADWSALRWPMSNTERTHSPPAGQPVPSIIPNLPDSYQASAHHEPDAALQALATLGEKAASIWPDLKDAVHLAEAGLYDEAAPIVRAAILERRAILKSGSPEAREALTALGISGGTWVAAARAARDHHSTARSVSMKQTQDSTEDAEALSRLRFPVAHATELWAHCQRWNIDPYLVLAVMRQESVYNPDALSPTGAIGLMQFIKGTGAKVSAMMGETLFSPHTLYDPSVNLKYSVYYLRLLSARFDGNFPIAVASYNGGPHHMSRAHRSTLGELNLDAFVEMIPRREPRDYVKKVVGFYQQYVSLYAPEGAGVVLPKRLRQDDPGVVDF
jgi:soluble lytic murein transglycosylase-like protein